MNEVWHARSEIVARGCTRGRLRSRRRGFGRQYVAATGSAAGPALTARADLPLACLIAMECVRFLCAGILLSGVLCLRLYAVVMPGLRPALSEPGLQCYSRADAAYPGFSRRLVLSRAPLPDPLWIAWRAILHLTFKYNRRERGARTAPVSFPLLTVVFINVRAGSAAHRCRMPVCSSMAWSRSAAAMASPMSVRPGCGRPGRARQPDREELSSVSP